MLPSSIVGRCSVVMNGVGGVITKSATTLTKNLNTTVGTATTSGSAKGTTKY